MTQTVIGVFDTPDAAHLAEERLISRGIDQSTLHVDVNDNIYGDSGSSPAARPRSTKGGIR